MNKKKKKYFFGRKHRQFYIAFDNKINEYVIKPVPEDDDYMKVLRIMIDELYLFMGSYAECSAFKKGYQLGYSTFKQYYKNNVDKVLKDISEKIFGNDIKMEEKDDNREEH